VLSEKCGAAGLVRNFIQYNALTNHRGLASKAPSVNSSAPPDRRSKLRRMNLNQSSAIQVSAAGLCGLVAAVACWSLLINELKGAHGHSKEESHELNLGGLVALAQESLAAVGIARMNLLCQQGLSGTQDFDINSSLSLIEQMAARV